MELSEYILSHEGYFWQWEDQGTVIAIPGGSTVAYSDLITDTLEQLAPQGLPPFGALLLAIIATNAEGRAALNDIDQVLRKKLGPNEQLLLTEANEFLNILSHVNDVYKKGPKRILLFRALFENCHNKVSSRKAARVVKDYSHYRQEYALFAPQPFSHGCFNRDFRTIALLYNKFPTAEDVIKRIAALPDLPEELLHETSVQVADPEDKDFIDQLIDNSKTFHTGALVRRIWSGLNIPVHSRLPSSQPLGGISDLTNKGDFDKLLVSEFANDDLVFLSRLANNEALFLHREIPPVNNDLERIILIDTSLRCWGTPKTVAFAVALAIAHHPKTDIRCSAYIVGNTCRPVSIDDIHGVIESLQMLETGLHAANGLGSFFREQQPGRDKEIFVISSPEAMKQAAAMKVMEDHRAMVHYRILADAEGNIDVYKNQQNSSRHIQHMQLPLEELWTQQKPKPQQVMQQVRDVPGLRCYPILFRNSHEPRATLPAADGEIFQVTKEKTLLRLFDKRATKYQRGWDVVFEKLPYVGGNVEIGIAENGDYVLLMFNPQSRELILQNVVTGECHNAVFSEWTSSSFKNFMYYRGSFYYLASGAQWQIKLDASIQKTTGTEEVLYAAYKARESAIANVSNIYAHTMLKNVHDIFINANGNLVLNTRELLINVGGHIKLEQKTEVTKVAHAVKTGDSEFAFADGSTITINRGGMAILRAARGDMEPIYIPLLLDMSLGVATNDTFAGNDYYYKEPMFEVILEEAGPQKLEIIRQVKEMMRLGLNEIKELVYCTPKKITAFTPRAVAEQYKVSLEQSGATVSIRPAAGRYPSQEKISVQEFFRRYITPFTQQILNHATGH